MSPSCCFPRTVPSTATRKTCSSMSVSGRATARGRPRKGSVRSPPDFPRSHRTVDICSSAGTMEISIGPTRRSSTHSGPFRRAGARIVTVDSLRVASTGSPRDVRVLKATSRTAARCSKGVWKRRQSRKVGAEVRPPPSVSAARVSCSTTVSRSDTPRPLSRNDTDTSSSSGKSDVHRGWKSPSFRMSWPSFTLSGASSSPMRAWLTSATMIWPTSVFTSVKMPCAFILPAWYWLSSVGVT
jgi:hypothetical protein